MVTNTITKVKSEDGYKYCFTTQSGYFVARRNGKIFITGNCGMLAAKIEGEIDPVNFIKVLKNTIPSGFETHDKVMVSKDEYSFLSGLKIDAYNRDRALKSIGTLGGGNHFIELCTEGWDSWIVIHSGSRYLGKQIAEYYQEMAYTDRVDEALNIPQLIKDLKASGRSKDIQAEIAKKKNQHGGISKHMAYLSGDHLNQYINDMGHAQYYATLNRATMMELITKALGDKKIVDRIETIHNYVSLSERMIRKGAVSAQKDELLIIPMNQAFGSFICKGKGNIDWNNSAPHGAGRLMSRSKAKASLSLDKVLEDMKTAGVYSETVNMSTLDEAPDAYKDPQEIQDAIVDTVDIVSVIKPIANFKASE